ncbi:MULTISPECIES: FxsB family cyclophane-forming radical SAM/SPASM peptide maturase [Streptomyces]|uniref:FxsB family radical SAM/SPASM domain protein n=1 Tax=Streptomyces siderophoricus TaxID=2802281 RepID=A0ABS1MLG0_9ACTN|nr:FxsB family cyclophane-forming radical SAM/SPASM peptide maturase [Streptomyces sp. 9-7]MBL1088396.1 FxsB family radical SAM/SPASM domain protein [Streptomyces sp. 9-7]
MAGETTGRSTVVPFRQFVLKVHSRCNLACTYCYIYAGPDRSWRERPRTVPAATVRQTALRIAEHARTHRLREIRVDLHGGEPLLTGPGPLLDQAAAVRAALPAGCTAHFGVQTNGTLLTPDTVDALAGAGFRIGLSLDGGTPGLNRRRLDHAGRPSWPALSRAVALLRGRPDVFAGILCTIDATADPAEVYGSLRALDAPMLDFLLPHANWSSPPPAALPAGAPRPVPPGPAGRSPYGDWLCTVFDLWWDGGPGPRVRVFTEILGLLLGRPSTSESVGLSPVVALVVDTDGAIEQVDSLKSAYEGAAATGLDVFRHSFDQALAHPGMAARRSGRAGLAAQCRSCALVEVCGGGNYAHRYRADTGGFTNPSVYCADLERLIRHIAARLDATVSPNLRAADLT